MIEFLQNAGVNLFIRCIPLFICIGYGLYNLYLYIQKYIMLKNSPKYKDIGTKPFKVEKVTKGFNSVTYAIISEDGEFKAEMYVAHNTMEKVTEEKGKKLRFPKYKILKKGEAYGDLHIYADPNNHKHYLVMGKDEKFKPVPHSWVMILCGVVMLAVMVGLGIWLFNAI